MGSYFEDFPQSSRSTMNLAYQNADEYPELIEEIENTISQRNKSRVQNTMRHFEYLSRRNKSMEKPLYSDDDERCQRYCRRHMNNCQNCEYCQAHCDKGRMYESRQPYNDYRFHRSRRCVEMQSNAHGHRSMDPSSSDSQIKYGLPRSDSNSSWQIDPRNGEWVKMCDNASYQYRDYPSNHYQETPNQHNNHKTFPGKLQHYIPSSPRHRSGSPKRHHDAQNVCTCHHYASYNRS